MICKKCNETGILNHANNKPFYYCRTCKIEITLEIKETSVKSTSKKVWPIQKLVDDLDLNRTIDPKDLDALNVYGQDVCDPWGEFPDFNGAD